MGIQGTLHRAAGFLRFQSHFTHIWNDSSEKGQALRMATT